MNTTMLPGLLRSIIPLAYLQIATNGTLNFNPNMYAIAQNTRYMEMVGFSVSLLSLVLSLVIFTRFRSLRNTRTRIHRNLFLALVIQVLVRLVLYVDQELVRSYSWYKGVDSLPYICESCYTLLEYGVCAMFCWMFIEGLFLHKIVTDNPWFNWIHYKLLRVGGWGLPFIITGIWAFMTSKHYSDFKVHLCWYGYNFLGTYWVCQGPSVAMVFGNLGFLVNIMRVIIRKLNRGVDSELEKIKKAARAAMVLLPLLGLTNTLSMIEAPIDGSVWKFALWSYTTHFLRSFQGFFISILYCFMNAEVRQVLMKVYRDWSIMRKDVRRMKIQAANNAARRHRRLQRNQEDRMGHQKWTETPCNPHSDIEVDLESAIEDYSDREELDRRPTIRFVNDTVIM